MPEGTPLQQTARVGTEIGRYLATVPEVANWQLYAGAARPTTSTGWSATTSCARRPTRPTSRSTCPQGRAQGAEPRDRQAHPRGRRRHRAAPRRARQDRRDPARAAGALDARGRGLRAELPCAAARSPSQIRGIFEGTPGRRRRRLVRRGRPGEGHLRGRPHEGRAQRHRGGAGLAVARGGARRVLGRASATCRARRSRSSCCCACRSPAAPASSRSRGSPCPPRPGRRCRWPSWWRCAAASRRRRSTTRTCSRWTTSSAMSPAAPRARSTPSSR